MLWLAIMRVSFLSWFVTISNPGRYLALLPPINGATAASGTSYFMPNQFVTFRGEFTYRHASVPYFAGNGGVTPPGGNQGSPGSTVMNADGTQWTPDLVRDEPRVTLALMVKM